MRRADTFKIIRVVVTLTTLVLGCAYMYLHRDELTVLASVSAGDVAVLAGCLFLVYLATGYTFFLLVSMLSTSLSAREWIGLTFLANVLNYLLPVRPGMAVKAAYLKRKEMAYSRFSSILAANVFYLLFFSALTGLSALTLQGSYNSRILFLGSICVLLILATSIPFFVPISRSGREGRMWNLLDNATQGFQEIRSRRGKAVAVGATILLQHALSAFCCLIAFETLGFEIDWLIALNLVAFASIANVFAVTPNNIGIQELIMAYVYTTFGLDFLDGLLGAALIRAVHIVVTFVFAPLFTYLLLSSEKLRLSSLMKKNGVSALVFLSVVSILALGCGTDLSDPPRPNVILILVDTLRADHLGAYGYDRNTSPTVDAFASRATLYESAMSQSPHTIPSVLQIMTSRYLQGREIELETPTVAELMRETGYETAAIVENANFEFSEDARGLMRGFDVFYRNGVLDRKEVFQQHWKSKTPADVITAQARRWLRKRESKRPFFLWLHYFDPHDPYMPPYLDDMEELSWNSASDYTGDIRNTSLFPKSQVEPSPFSEADRTHLIALYDAEIRYFDQSLAELLEFLAEWNLLESSLIILSADHGESLGEHDLWTHGVSLYDPEVHIPLIVKYPGQKRGERIEAPVEAIDILPTILDVANVEAEHRFDGTSLRGNRSRAAFTFWSDWSAVRTEDWKFLQHGEERFLFHIGNDPDESLNLAVEEPEVVRRLLQARAAKLAEIESSQEELEAVSNEAIELMRSLGYLE